MTEILDTPVETPTETGWVNPDGTFGEGTPEKIKNLIEAKGWDTVEKLADGFIGLEKFKGAGKHLLIPDSEDSEAWAEVYNTLGRPETHDKYEIDYDGEVPVSDEIAEQFKQYAYKLGLTQKQFNEVVRFQLDAVEAQNQIYEAQLAEQKEKNIAALKAKWGDANYDSKLKAARTIADRLGIYQTLEAKGLASDPDIISMLDVIAQKTAEDVITPSTPSEPSKSPLEELEEIKKDPAFTNKFDPKHKDIMKRFMELNTIIANTGIGPKRSR